MRRPWKVRWWSSHDMAWRGSSFATREPALARGRSARDEGGLDVFVWMTSKDGTVVPNTVTRIP